MLSNLRDLFLDTALNRVLPLSSRILLNDRSSSFKVQESLEINSAKQQICSFSLQLLSFRTSMAFCDGLLSCSAIKKSLSCSLELKKFAFEERSMEVIDRLVLSAWAKFSDTVPLREHWLSCRLVIEALVSTMFCKAPAISVFQYTLLEGGWLI